MSERSQRTSSLKYDGYSGITPGYHINKKHWISVHGGEKITAELLESLIDDSRDRVIDTLPLRVQQRLRPR